MRKFTFFKKTATEPFSREESEQILAPGSGFQEIGIPSLEEAQPVASQGQVEVNRAHREGLVEEARILSDRKRQRKDLEAPYAVLSGNPNDEFGFGSRITFYHHSLPQYASDRDAHGRLKVHEQKKILSRPDSGYESIILPLESYAHNKEFARLAPNGLRTFVKKGATGTQVGINVPAEVQQARQVASSNRANSILRSTTGGQPDIDELDPNHPLNIFEEVGPEALLSDIFTSDRRPSKTSQLDDLARTKICVCGNSEEEHTDAAGNQRRHKFTPQYVVNSEGKAVPGARFRADQSPLRFSVSPANRSDDPESPSTRYVLQAADGGSWSRRMPVVTVSTGNMITNRYYEAGTGVDEDGRPVSPVTSTSQVDTFKGYEKCKGRKGAPCFNGRTDPISAQNKTLCETCTPGTINYTSDGSRPFSEGIGNGQVRILNQEDLPECTSCNGEKGRWQSNKSEQEWIPCKGCGETGKDRSALKGTQCTNCNSSDSTIDLAGSSLCTECGGSGHSDVKITKKPKGPKPEVTINDISLLGGNPITLTGFDDSGYGDSHIDGFLGTPDPECPNCGGDDTYTETDEYGVTTPCKNCMIGSFDDPHAIVAPKGARFVGSTGIDIPEIMFQRALFAQFKDDPTKNPHSRVTDFKAVDKKTQKVSPDVSYITPGKDGNQRYFDGDTLQGVMTPGISITPETLSELQRRSKIHRAHPNAEFIAGPRELADIKELVLDKMDEQPMNMPDIRQDEDDE
jgi:hypothetical protein